MPTPEPGLAGAEPQRPWTLDGEPFDIQDSDLGPEELALATAMAVGDEMMVGGGAFAEFILKRIA